MILQVINKFNKVHQEIEMRLFQFRIKKKGARVKISKRNQKLSFNREKIKKANFINILKARYSKVVTTIQVLEMISKKSKANRKNKITQHKNIMEFKKIKINKF